MPPPLEMTSPPLPQCERSVRVHLEAARAAVASRAGVWKRALRAVTRGGKPNGTAWGRPLDDLLQHRGLGSTVPLREYADGGNYEANRRVEVRLLEPGQEGWCSPFGPVPPGGPWRPKKKKKKKRKKKDDWLARNRRRSDAAMAATFSPSVIPSPHAIRAAGSPDRFARGHHGGH